MVDLALACKAARAVLLVALPLWANGAAAQGSVAPIPWKPGLTFSRTAVDDDVRGILRAILLADGLSVIFSPGTYPTASFNFRDMPLDAAFSQVLEAHGLQAAYNAATRTVTVGPMGSPAAARHFLTLQNVDWPSLRQMLTSFGIGTSGVSFDPSTSVLSLSGDPNYVAQVEDLVHTLEQHQGDARDRAAAESARSASAQRSAYESRSYQDELNVQTRVFRLRFADVGPTQRSFHGRAVVIPGILETLQAMLGQGGGGMPYIQQQPAASPFVPALSARGAAGQAAPAGLPASAPAERGPSIGRPSISIDQRTNSVIVRGSPAAIAAVEDVLRQIDQPVKMVEIEVVIATAELGVIDSFGVAFRSGAAGQHGGGALDTGTSGGQFGGTIPINPLTLFPATAAGSTVASFVFANKDTSIQAQIQALASENKARVLSAPHVVTLDNVTARITRSEDIYVPVDTGGLNGQGLSQIQTGLTLEITPSIVPAARGSSDKLVRLTLDATNSSPGSGVGQNINVNSQEVQTDVLVPDGGTYVIGGLFDDSRLQSRQGVPVLKDIPLLGALFRTDNKQQSLGETIFFITPRIIDQTQLVDRQVALGPATAAYIDEQRGRLVSMSRKIAGVAGTRSTAVEEDQ